jgi:hypothetical protein
VGVLRTAEDGKSGMNCDVREELQRKVAEAYEEMWNRQYESKSAEAKARAKLNRLLIQKHSHERKHGCLRVDNSK